MNDKDLEQRYRAASTEQPSAAADAAILALARAAAAETVAAKAVATALETAGGTRPAAKGSTLRRWRTPLGLAASLVLAVGIVSRVQVEEDAGIAPGSVPIAAPASEGSLPAPAPTNATVPASAATSTNAASVPTTPSVTPALPRATDAKDATPQAFPAQKSAVREPAPAQARVAAPSVATPAEAVMKPDALEKRKALADSVITADATVRKELASPARDAEESKRSAPFAASAGAGGAVNSARAPAAAPAAPAAISPAASPEVSAAAPAMTPSVSPQPAPLARNAAAASAEAQRDDATRSRAAVAVQGRSLSGDSFALNEATEAALTPEQWLRRIIDARRAGRDIEADASLRRFINKNPALPVPPEARRAGER